MKSFPRHTAARLRAFSRLLAARLQRRRIPLNVFFAVTNRCNKDCAYCYGAYPRQVGVPEFTTAEILQLLAELRQLGTVFLQLQGGEPLLRDDIDKIVATARAWGFNVDLITNGTLVAEKIEVIRQVDSVCVSLDGPRETHERFRGAGSFATTVAAIRSCVRLGIATRINAMLTPASRTADIDYLLDFARREQVFVNFSTSFHFRDIAGSTATCRQYMLSPELWRQLLSHICAAASHGAPLQFTRASYLRSAAWPLPPHHLRATAAELPSTCRLPPCRHGDYVAFINADGRLYPCCNYWNDYPRFDVREHGFLAAWQQLDRLGCCACPTTSYIERNAILEFSPGTLLHYLLHSR